MTDIHNLKALAEAATKGPWKHGKNSDDVVADFPGGHEQDPHEIDYYGGHLIAESISSQNRDFITAANPAAVLELIAEIEHLEQFKTSYNEWHEKTEPLLQGFEAGELGRHRADVLRSRFHRLKTTSEALQQRLTVADQRIDDLEEALNRVLHNATGQLEIIAARAPGKFLDKAPVISVLGQYKRIATETLAIQRAPTGEQCQFPQSCPVTCGCSSKGTSS